MEKLILTIAPTGNVPTKEMTPHVPVTPQEIAADVAACYARGASVAHLHARDASGRPTASAAAFQAILAALDATRCPIVRQLSTGARGTTHMEERAEALSLAPASASLATGSSNFPQTVNSNAPPLIEALAARMLEKRIKPELEIFDTAMLANALALEKRGLLKPPLHFNFVLGVKGAQPAAARNLFFLVESLPPGCSWGVSVIGPKHVELSAIAIALGGHVRVGIEDNLYYEKGVLGANAQMVERIARIAAAVGRDLATPADVKRIWQLE